MEIKNNIYCIGVNDEEIDLFESQYQVPNGMRYNSYLIKDEKNVVIDTIDKNVTDKWLKKLENTLKTGKHTLKFFMAPMVHWPEVMFTYEQTDKILFTADAFGKFGANREGDKWLDEARRFYIGIVGKYGPQVQTALKKIQDLNIKMICPLHGFILKDNLKFYIDKQKKKEY